MNKAEHYIQQATTERVRSRALIRTVATEAIRYSEKKRQQMQSQYLNRCARQE